MTDTLPTLEESRAAAALHLAGEIQNITALLGKNDWSKSYQTNAREALGEAVQLLHLLTDRTVEIQTETDPASEPAKPEPPPPPERSHLDRRPILKVDPVAELLAIRIGESSVTVRPVYTTTPLAIEFDGHADGLSFRTTWTEALELAEALIWAADGIRRYEEKNK